MAVIVLAAAVILCLLECIRELNTFKVTQYKVSGPEGKRSDPNIRIVFLSDLHNHVYGKKNDSLFQTIAKQKPDLILIGGDMLIGRPQKTWQPAADLISRLPSICPVYYANGNHEHRMKVHPEKYGAEYKKYKRTLEKKGVIFLENSSVKLKQADLPLQINGLEIPQEYYEKMKSKELSVRTVRKCIGKFDPEYFQVVLAHNPEYFETYREWGADLVLSGHLHGGVARIPGFRGVISTQGKLFPKYSGEMTKENQSVIVVSKGLGTHTVNLRFLNMAEVVVLDII